jgi:hypothetical protein
VPNLKKIEGKALGSLDFGPALPNTQHFADDEAWRRV